MATDSLLLALTGATGFIGGWTARHLVCAGWRVRVLVRPGSEHRLPLPDLEICRGCLENPADRERLLEGASHVVHCAGVVRGRHQSDFDAINAVATGELARMAVAMGVSRFIQISSLAAREPHLSPYALSKRRGEEALERFAHGLSWLVLRPPAVYGPGDREMLPLLKAMSRGLVPVIGGRGSRFSLLYVEDLARAVVAAVNADRISQVIFELDDGKREGYSWSEVIEIAARYREGWVLPLTVPESLLRGVAGVSEIFSRISGKAPMLTSAKVNELRHPDWVCDNTPIFRSLNWRPVVPFDVGLRKTLET